MVNSNSLVNVNEDEKKLFGFYRGTVLKHLTFGRCKVYIHGVYDPTLMDTPDLIPDAEQAASLFGGCNTGNGVFTYPNIGTTVWCFFANGDQNMPVFFASTLGGDNAFGQYGIIMPPRTRESLSAVKEKINESIKDNSKISSINTSEDIVSDKHLITAKNTQLEFYESGILSAVVKNPYQLPAIIQHSKSKFQYDQQFDRVSSYPFKEAVDDKEVSSINCQLVLNNTDNNGEISTSTHFYNLSSNDEKTLSTTIDNDIKLNNVDNIVLSTITNEITHENKDNKDYITRDAEARINMKSKSFSGIYEYARDDINDCEIILNKVTSNPTGIHECITDDYKKCKITLDRSTADDRFDIIIQNSTSGSTDCSKIYLDKFGNITIESTTAITVKSKIIKVDAEDQLDLHSTAINMKADTNIALTSKAVLIDTSNGLTKINSYRGTTVL